MIFFPGPSTHILMPFPSQCPKAVVSEPSLQFSLASSLSPFLPLSSLSLSFFFFFCKLIAFSYFQNLLNSSTRETKLPRNSFQTSALRWLIRVSTHIASSLVLGRCINYYCDKKSKTVKWGKGCINPAFTSYGLLALLLLSHDWKYMVKKNPFLMVIIIVSIDWYYLLTWEDAESHTKQAFGCDCDGFSILS